MTISTSQTYTANRNANWSNQFWKWSFYYLMSRKNSVSSTKAHNSLTTYVWIPPHTHTKQFGNTSWVFYNSIQSDIIYLKIASDSTGQGLSLTRLLATTFPTTQAQLVICTSDWWTVNQRFPQAPSQVQLICKSHSQNSGKQFTY